MTAELINLVSFINLEADMLDFHEYDQWLDLWDEDGYYIVPIDGTTEDYANTLNFAYDDAAMRRLRVQRLVSGEAVSTETTAKTIRNPSRFRVLSTEGDVTTIRCAQIINENRHGNLRYYPADVTYKLRRDGDSYRILEKVIRLQNADNHLASIGYIL
ncbi:MAG: hypothetical protein HWE30_17530 [Methylocystaceae bacterium]|nr:hypothetical protein [Methylocystaceae bacterium]